MEADRRSRRPRDTGCRTDYSGARYPRSCVPAAPQGHSARRRAANGIPRGRRRSARRPAVTIQQAAQALRSRKVSSVELTREALRRIEALNPKLNAIQTLMDDSALESARQADHELAHDIDFGPLHGIPIAVKDLFETKGVRTTCG